MSNGKQLGAGGPRDEILEKMRSQAGQKPVSHGRHDLDGVEALGDWLIVERTEGRVESTGGILIPEQARVPVWTALSVGPKVAERLGREVKVGDRLLFTNPTATFVQDGRGFAFMRWDAIVAVLQPPTDAPLVELAS